MFRFLLIYVASLILSINSSHAACAQDTASSSSIARIIYIQDVPAVESNELRGSLEALIEETDSLKKAVSSSIAEPGRSLHSKNTPMRHEPKQTESFAPIPTLSISSSGKTDARQGSADDIIERIELLKRIYSQRDEAARNERLKKATTPGAPKKVSSSETSPIVSSDTGTNSASMETRLDTPDSATTSLPRQAPATKSVSVPVTGTSTPADLFELGNSLYQIGDLRTAFEVYSQVERETITSTEAVWLDFMIASCHRRMGNWKDATNLYRELANQSTAPSLAKPAKVWLKQVELFSNSELEFSNLKSQVESLVEKAEVHVQE